MPHSPCPVTSRTSVVIVGAGPAGLTFANLLLDAGVDCMLLESKAAATAFGEVYLGEGPRL